MSQLLPKLSKILKKKYKDFGNFFFTPPNSPKPEHFFGSDSDFWSRKCVLRYQNRFAPSLDGFWKKNKIFHVLDQFSRFCGATNFFDDPKYGIFALFSASTGLEATIAKNTYLWKKFVAPHMHQKWKIPTYVSNSTSTKLQTMISFDLKKLFTWFLCVRKLKLYTFQIT